MDEDVGLVILFIFVTTIAFIVGVLCGISIQNSSIDKDICEQLYTQTSNYIQCVNKQTLSEHIKLIKYID